MSILNAQKIREYCPGGTPIYGTTDGVISNDLSAVQSNKFNTGFVSEYLLSGDLNALCRVLFYGLVQAQQRIGPWCVDVEYAKNALVLHSDNWYMATTANVATSSNAPGQVGSPWQLLRDKIRDESIVAHSWEIGKSYRKGTILEKDSLPFICRVNHTSTASNAPNSGGNQVTSEWIYLGRMAREWSSDSCRWEAGITYYEWQTIIHSDSLWFYNSNGSSVATSANAPGQSGSPWIPFQHYIGAIIFPPKTYFLTYDTGWTTASLTTRYGGNWEKLPPGEYLVSGTSDGTLDPELPNIKGSILVSRDGRGGVDNTGAFYTWDRERTSIAGNYAPGATNFHLNAQYYYFSANSYSSIYKDSGTVRPKSRKVICYYRSS